MQQQSRVAVPGRRRCVAVSASAAVVSAAARRAAARRHAAALANIRLLAGADSAAGPSSLATNPATPIVRPLRQSTPQPQATKTLKIGTRGSPLALAQAYLTRDLLKASGVVEGGGWQTRSAHLTAASGQL